MFATGHLLVRTLATIHNGTMKIRSHPSLIAAAVAAVLLASLLLALLLSSLVACGGSGGDADPQAVLAAASAKMKTIKGFHFEYEVHQPEGAEPSSGLYIARIIGDVNAEGNMKSNVDATMGGLPVSLGLVAVGDMYYIEDPLSRKWQSLAAADSPVGKLSLDTGTIRILDRITEASYEGEESKGGQTCYHITGMVAAEEVKAVAGLVDTTDPFPTEIWIGVADGLVYEVDIAGPATPDEDEGIWRSIVLSDHDTNVEIEAPQ
jgi:lipoprotein LprG